MKTRREFFKTLAGSMAMLAACVMAPKSLMAAGEGNPFNLDNVKKGLRKMDYLETHDREFFTTYSGRTSGRTADYVTSGYAQADILKSLEKTIGKAYPRASMARIRGRDGLTRLHWSSGGTLEDQMLHHIIGIKGT